MTRRAAMDLYRRLRDAQGPQGWWPADTPIEMAIGAVLTQNTAWINVERALDNLRTDGLLDARALLAAPDAALAARLRPSGYFNVKARRVKALAAFLAEHVDGDPARLAGWDPARARAALLAVPGVGRETADSILLYAAGHPVFVIDAYTRRVAGRLGLADPRTDYDVLRRAFEAALPRNAALFNDFHAQLVVHAKDRCRVRPRCGGCPLADTCPAAPSDGAGAPDGAASRGGRR
jgi:endonuclease-3 related protein